MNHFVRMCQSSKKKVHVAEEAEGFESEESLLQLEEIKAISGSGKQLTSSITLIVDDTFTLLFSFSYILQDIPLTRG